MTSCVVTCRSFVASCLMLAMFGNFAARTEARPQYKAAFDATYPNVVKANKTNCNVCHFGDGKKNRNHYGEDLRKELKKPTVTDEKTIKNALKAIENGDCKTGKWKERLKKGEWPCTDESNTLDTHSYIARQLAHERHEDR